MAGAAAFFDLDRTLFRGSSTPALNQALFEHGLARRAGVPGPGAGDAVLRHLRRDPAVHGDGPGGRPGRKGLVCRARCARPPKLRPTSSSHRILPYVPALLDSHRLAGRVLVLATTTPYDLIEPLARRLGFDDVIATR